VIFDEKGFGLWKFCMLDALSLGLIFSVEIA